MIDTCPICWHAGHYQYSCSYNHFMSNLLTTFQAGFSFYYEISLAKGIITCYQEDGIIWGKLSTNVLRVYKIAGSEGYYYNWIVDDAKLQLYFSSSPTSTRIHDIITDLNHTVRNEYELLAKHRVYIT